VVISFRSCLVAAVVTIAALSLAACYTSGHLLLDPDEAAHPFEDGTYERADDSHAGYHLSREPDGWYGVEEVNANGTLGQTRRVLFTPLPVGDLKAFAAAEESEDGFTYAVVIQQGERVYLATPDCADALDASLAVDHGARQDDDEAMTHNCFFSSREAVTAALGDYAGQADFGAPYLKK
jgi:hypothetical protein